ncbi:MAG: hypothetical protein RL651_988 [Pseudomonadota bacterium]|jgi:hypothetical protein
METLTSAHTLELVPFFKNLPLAILGLLGALWINVFFLRRIAINFEIRGRICLNRNRPTGVFHHYFAAIIYLMIVQIMVIILWGIALNALSLIKDPMEAIMFAGSCYTTMGIVTEVMPTGWKFIAIVIALSGLFAIALATSSMINMSTLFRRAWLTKHATRIEAILQRENIEIPDFVSIEETIKVKETVKTTDHS